MGWGAAAFSVIYPLRTGFWHGHPHNLPIDLALSHGEPRCPAAGGSCAVVVDPLRPARHELEWWAVRSGLVAAAGAGGPARHCIPMYDSRINVAGWVLLVGLRTYQPLDRKAAGGEPVGSNSNGNFASDPQVNSGPERSI